jgi:hypothetical protein
MLLGDRFDEVQRETGMFDHALDPRTGHQKRGTVPA